MNFRCNCNHSGPIRKKGDSLSRFQEMIDTHPHVPRPQEILLKPDKHALEKYERARSSWDVYMSYLGKAALDETDGNAKHKRVNEIIRESNFQIIRENFNNGEHAKKD